MKLSLNEPRLLIKSFEKLFFDFSSSRELSKRYTFLNHKHLNSSHFYFHYRFSFSSNRFLSFFDSNYRSRCFNDCYCNVYKNEMIIFLIDAHFLYF